MTVVATIVEIDPKDPLKTVGEALTVDFNPSSLRLTHTAAGPPGGQVMASATNEKQSVAKQQTGYTTGLSMELLFDTSRTGRDVRQKTLFLVALTRPQSSAVSNGRPMRFSWGSFLFNGCLDSLGETIDLFSADGVPLRATVAVSLRGLAERDPRPSSGGGTGAGSGFGASASASVSFGASASASASFGATAGASFGASAGASFVGAAAGTTPLTITASGDTIQSLAARAGVSWKALAAANGIDNPLVLPPGTVLDVRVGR